MRWPLSPWKKSLKLKWFDEATAVELQTRAREYLEKTEIEMTAKVKELKVEDELSAIPELTSALLVKLGENEIRNIEDLAGCATDELTGWIERKEEQNVRHSGIFLPNEMSAETAEAMIMKARVTAGWITQEDLDGESSEEATEQDAEVEAEAPAS